MAERLSRSPCSGKLEPAYPTLTNYTIYKRWRFKKGKTEQIRTPVPLSTTTGAEGSILIVSRLLSAQIAAAALRVVTGVSTPSRRSDTVFSFHILLPKICGTPSRESYAFLPALT